jgi:hypothetical protein
VLSEAFYQGRLTSTPSFDELLKIDSPAVRAYQMALAIVDLARSQVIMEGRLDDYGPHCLIKNVTEGGSVASK